MAEENTAKPAQRVPRAIRGIYLRSSKSRMESDFNPFNPGQQLHGNLESISQTIGSSVNEQGHPIGVLYATAFRFTYSLGKNSEPDPEEDRLVAEVEAEFLGEYVDLPENFTPEEAQRFGARPVMTHMWPFWREFLYSQFHRMSLPPAPMPPLFMLGPESSEQAKDGAADVSDQK